MNDSARWSVSLTFDGPHVVGLNRNMGFEDLLSSDTVCCTLIWTILSFIGGFVSLTMFVVS